MNRPLSAMRNKTDKTDARGIAQILRTGWFSPVHMKSREAHGLRALLSTRKALLKKTMDLANEVRGLLKIFGIRLPKTVTHGSFDSVVRPMIEIDDILAHALVPLLDARVVLYQNYLELDRRVKRAASQDGVCMKLMTIPGVGPIAALSFKAAVDDPTRFKKSRTVAAYFGLTPRRYQSGEHDNPGRISKAGDREPQPLPHEYPGYAACAGHSVENDYKPQQNAYIERYNRTVRNEWLGVNIFHSIQEVQEYATQWLWTYNNDRPNMGIGGVTPAMKLNQYKMAA